MFINLKNKHIKNTLNHFDWDILEENFKILKIFAKATVILSAYEKPILYQVEDVYLIIKNYLDKHETSVHDIIAGKLEEYLVKISTAHWLAQILHPGIKLNKND